MESVFALSKTGALRAYMERYPISKEKRRQNSYRIELQHIEQKLDRGFERRLGKKFTLTIRTRQKLVSRMSQLNTLISK